MKKFLIFIVLLFGLGIFIYTQPQVVKPLTNFFYYSSCDTPQYYAIGSVDPRFNLSQEEFAQAIDQAVVVWSEAEGKTLFVQSDNTDKKGLLNIRLVYDKRQLLNTQVNSIENQVEEKKNVLQNSITRYESDLASFKKRAADLNNRIEEWNNKGGAPKDEYEKLVSEQKALQEEGNTLNDRARQLNLSTDSYNADVGSLHQAVDTFNQALEKRPEEGLYDPKDNSITIYFNNSQPELVHTLAHEFGHALGINHIQNEEAIMFPYVNEVITPSVEDIAALHEVCRERSIIELFEERLKQMKKQ